MAAPRRGNGKTPATRKKATAKAAQTAQPAKGRKPAKAAGAAKPTPPKRQSAVSPPPPPPAPEGINHADDLLPDDGLTWRQKMFVEAYLGPARLNATEAARMAGYSATSRQSLKVQGYRLLTNAAVQSRVRARLNQIAPTRETLLERIGVLAGSDMSDLFAVREVNGNVEVVLDLVRAAERGALGLLRECKQIPTDNGVIHVVKTHDPAKYLEMLAKHVGLLAGGANDIPTDAAPRKLSDDELIEYYREQGWELPDALDPKPPIKGLPKDEGGER